MNTFSHINSMNIALTVDSNMVEYTKPLLYSLFMTQESKLDIYFLFCDIDDSKIQEIEVFCKTLQFNFFPIEVPQSIVTEISAAHSVDPLNPMSPVLYFRLFLPSLLPDHVSKILYLDTDTLVTQDLFLFYCLNFYNNFFIATVDPCTYLEGLDSIKKKFYNKISFSENSSYMNVGVLLMNIKDMRKHSFFTVPGILSCIKEHPTWNDQDILNSFFLNKSFILTSTQYNCHWELSDFKNFENNKIVHYMGVKPWDYVNPLPSGIIYWRYINKLANVLNNAISKGK